MLTPSQSPQKIVVKVDKQSRYVQLAGGISSYTRLLLSNLQNPFYTRSPHGVGRRNPSLVHHTFYIPFYPSTFTKLPRVVTIYDFIPETEKGFRKRRVHLAKNWYIKNSDGVIYISDTVRRQAEALGHNPKIWAVTHLASRYQYPTTKPPERNKDQVLFVGNRSGYKNFELLPPALLKAKKKNLELVLVGGKKLSRREIKNLSAHKVNFKHINSASDSDLKELYLESQICLIPSLKEGFGLPMIEAMSLGCPVIAIDTEITNEVGGDAVVKISESDPTLWAKAIDSLIEDENLWDSFSKAGIKRSQNFSWEKTVELTANLYRRVLKASGGKAD